MKDNALKIVILSGLSGAGKSVALKAFEDIGYYCIDNLPAVLIKPLVSILNQRENLRALAVGFDIREKDFLPDAYNVIKELKQEVHLEILFLEASEDALLRRYRETRRPHPMESLGGSNSLQEAIRLEKELLNEMRSYADRIIDTSNYNPHELRRLLQSIYSDTGDIGQLKITLMSFGFKHGIPQQADMLFDGRFLPNPYFHPDLRPLKGTDPQVYEFVLSSPETQRFIALIVELLSFVIPHYRREGRSYLTIAVGCTGGRHRSPAIVSKIAEEIGSKMQITPRLLHRDIENA